MIDFQEFKKIPRLSRDCVITEKIDGTNAVIYIDGNTFLTGSRKRWITPEDDNYGFSKWAHEHKDELMGLGDGFHYGEWWGQGIQRNYGLKEKRFSLFNVKRWGEERPACCHVVPTIYSGLFSTDAIERVLSYLKDNGSVAAPGFTKPEGVIIYHVAGGHLYKKTIDRDEEPKGLIK